MDQKFKPLQAERDENARSSRASRASNKRSTTSDDEVLHWTDNHQVYLIEIWKHITGWWYGRFNADPTSVVVTTKNSSKRPSTSAVISQQAVYNSEAVSSAADFRLFEISPITTVQANRLSQPFDDVISPIAIVSFSSYQTPIYVPNSQMVHAGLQ